jgi:hypothetical protein
MQWHAEYIPVWLQTSFYPLHGGEISSRSDIHKGMWYSHSAAVVKWEVPVRSPLPIAEYIYHQIFVKLFIIQGHI